MEPINGTSSSQGDVADSQLVIKEVAVTDDKEKPEEDTMERQCSSIRSQCPMSGVTRPKPIPLKCWITAEVRSDVLHTKSRLTDTTCRPEQCMGSIMFPPRPASPKPKDQVLEEAEDFINQYYQSIKRLESPAHQKRLRDVLTSIQDSGTYELTAAELTFGAKTAWRNASRCIGRIQWSKLQVFDARHIRSARAMFEAICNHIKYGTNKGNIRSAITIFPARTDAAHDYRVWNPQLIRYAGYRHPDGTVTGDPASLELTELCQKLGWRSPGGKFDVLPLVLQANGQDPEMFIIPDDLVLQVDLSHPQYDWFADMGLRWFALPAVSSMNLDCGGLEFTACPFNGWYMSPEIATRNLCDSYRYNITEAMAKHMGLDTRTNATLWKDRALVEVNVAVLHSFQKAVVTLVDHHTIAESFMKHMDNEYRLRGGCPTDWVWVVPPISGSLTPVFHQEMLNYKLKPSYEYQNDPLKTYKWKNTGVDDSTGIQRTKKLRFKDIARAIKFSAKLMRSALAKRIKCTILYATETGRSERYAKTLCEMFKISFDARVLCMKDYDFIELEHEALVLIVTSTFGNGDPPENGIEFAEELYNLRHPYAAKNTIKKSASITYVQDMEPEPQPSNEDVTSPVVGNGHVVNGKEPSTSIDYAEACGNVRFSVFALGSTAYPSFCAFGRYVDRLLTELGGERIQEMAEGDELCGQEEAFNSWSKKTFKAACEAFCIEDQLSIDHASAALSKADSTWSPGKYRLGKVEEAEDLTSALKAFHNKNVHRCHMISRTQLQSPDSDGQTILVRLDTLGNQELLFVPGDHVAMFPVNRAELVDVIMSRLSTDVDPDQPVQLEILKEKNTILLGDMKYWTVDDRLSFATTVRSAFKNFIDITTPPTPTLLGQLANLATNEEDRLRLTKLSKDSRAYDDWRYTVVPTLADVMSEFPSVKFAPTMLLSQLPMLQPRYYSISSSPETYPGEIHATVSVVKFKSHHGDGEQRYGVCSNWLNTIREGQLVQCFVRSAPQFHMPEDPSSPVIMVGPGTGVAPFRGFWQKRMKDQSKRKQGNFAPMSLYFGCRKLKKDNIYQKEKAKMVDAGVLKPITVALSREPNIPKTYVQHVLMSDGQSIYNQIMLDKGHIYVCGDVAMAADVRKTLENIMETFGDFTESEAKSFVLKMREHNMYHEDIFGITLNTFAVQRKAREMAVQRRWFNVVRAAKILSKGSQRSKKT